MRPEVTRVASALAVAALVLGVACPPTGAQPDASTAQEASRLYVFPRDDSDRLDVHVFVPYRAEVPGLAHYVEHLAWLSATGDWASNRRGRTGAWTNAHTIHYWISAQGGSVDELVETIGRRQPPPTIEIHRVCYKRSGPERQFPMMEDRDYFERRFRDGMSANLRAAGLHAEVFIWTTSTTVT